MSNETNRRRLFQRRSFILGAGKVALFSVLTGRLYYLQFVRGQEFQVMADNNRIKIVLTSPERGRILDRYGAEMAASNINYQLYLRTERGQFAPMSFVELAAILDVDPVEFERAVKKRKPVNDEILIAEHLSWEQLAAVQLRTPEFPGLLVETGKRRFYPYNDVTAHLLGYVGTPSAEDGDEGFFRRLPDLKIGKRGIELAFETDLRGQAGVKQQEVNSTGLVVREISAQPSIKGKDLATTVDLDLQIFAHQRLMQEKSAAAVVMDVNNGEIYALSSTPSFDPNEFSTGISKKLWFSLLNNARSPLLNKCIAGQYPPGSTYKMLIGLAGLESGKINAASRFTCPGFMDLGSHRFHCWKRDGHGSVSIREAIQQSCDVFFYNVSLRTGNDPIAVTARKFGMGKPTGIELPGELSGIVPDQAWKQKRFKQAWQTGDTVNGSIGQGYVLSTPLQLANMTAQIANGGKKLRPTLIKTDAAVVPSPIDIKAEHLALVREGMDWVVNHAGGTAYGKRIAESGMEMAGKTGTSQVRSLSNIKSFSKDDIYWIQQHHGLFVGYAPVNAPKFACAVIVEHGGSGSGAAAPIARDLLLKAQQLAASKNMVSARSVDRASPSLRHICESGAGVGAGRPAPDKCYEHGGIIKGTKNGAA